MQLALTLLLLVFAVPTGQTGKVTHVSDGDSFILANGERVRMIGINAPELAEKLGPESKEHLATLIRGKTVTLERDPQNDDRDVHGRLLRYVLVDGVDINRQMIADGWAYAFLRYKFAREKREAYREAEAGAKASRVGVWAAESRGAPAEPGRSVPTPTVGEGQGWPGVLKWIIGGVILILVLWMLIRIARR